MTWHDMAWHDMAWHDMAWHYYYYLIGKSNIDVYFKFLYLYLFSTFHLMPLRR